MNDATPKIAQLEITDSTAEFRLLRLILLDSYSPGGEAIIDLSNGALLTGDNGAGRTG